MPSSVNILMPNKTVPRKVKGEAKSALTKERKTPEIGMVEVQGKREAPKKEKKKMNGSTRKKQEALKKSTRKKKSVSGSSDVHEVATPSLRTKKTTTTTSNASDDKTVDKKKDDGSKMETPKSTAKTPNSKKFNMELAQKYFKRMAESQKVGPRKKDEDTTVETMPDSNQFGCSTRSKKGKTKKSKKQELDPNVFKENGEPVWVVPDRKPDELVMNESGEMERYPELSEALRDEGLEMEDGKGWIQKITLFLSGELNQGRVDTSEAIQDIDPFASFKVLTERAEQYFNKETILYNTADTLVELNHKAMERFSQQEEACGRREMDSRLRNVSKEEEEKTCIVTSIRFNNTDTCCVSYDRRRPITSIQKFKRTYRDHLKKEKKEKEKEKEIEKEKEKEEAPTKKGEVNSKKEELHSKKVEVQK